MFTFKLQSTLNYRKTVEEQKLVEFAERKRFLDSAMRELETIRKDIVKLHERLKEMQLGLLNVNEIKQFLAYLELSRDREKLQMEVVSKATSLVEAHREKLLEAVKDRKVLDVIMEKQYKEYKAKIASLERLNADEAAILRYARKCK